MSEVSSSSNNVLTNIQAPLLLSNDVQVNNQNDQFNLDLNFATQNIQTNETENLITNENQPVLNKNGKRNFRQKFNSRKFKKQKVAKRPVYREGIQPAQILNEVHPGLVFAYDVDTSTVSKVKFICNVEIQIKDEQTSEIKIFKFSGEGLSKKDAKKICCNQALVSLYSDTYKPPAVELQPTQTEAMLIDQMNSKISAKLNDLKKRISKIVNKSTVNTKSPAQILHELSVKISETSKCIQENGQTADKKFCFQIDNVPDESLVSLDQSNFITLYAHGFGKSKKEAKNQASRQALRQFFECDLEQIAIEPIITN